MRDYKKLFENNNIDAVIVISEKNRKYFSTFASTFGYLVLLPTKSLFITDARYYEMALSLQELGIEVRPIAAGLTGSASEIIMSMLDDYFKENNVAVIGYEDTELTVEQFNSLSAALPKYTFVGCGGQINAIRQIKDSEELSYIKKAQSITDATFADMLKIIKPGMSEIDIAVELQYRIHKNGGHGLAFDTIIASGTNSSKPHAHPTDKLIVNGDAITMDFGASYNGYCSDMTRTIFVGEPSEEMKKIYDIVALAQNSAITKAYVGMTGGELDSLAREVIIANGYGQYFTHSTGHSLGIDIHETPASAIGRTDVLRSGMLMTVEPGIYIPNVGGVRIEDIILFEEDKVIDLTTSPKNIIIL